MSNSSFSLLNLVEEITNEPKSRKLIQRLIDFVKESISKRDCSLILDFIRTRLNDLLVRAKPDIRNAIAAAFFPVCSLRPTCALDLLKSCLPFVSHNDGHAICCTLMMFLFKAWDYVSQEILKRESTLDAVLVSLIKSPSNTRGTVDFLSQLGDHLLQSKDFVLISWLEIKLSTLLADELKIVGTDDHAALVSPVLTRCLFFVSDKINQTKWWKTHIQWTLSPSKGRENDSKRLCLQVYMEQLVLDQPCEALWSIMADFDSKIEVLTHLLFHNHEKRKKCDKDDTSGRRVRTIISADGLFKIQSSFQYEIVQRKDLPVKKPTDVVEEILFMHMNKSFSNQCDLDISFTGIVSLIKTLKEYNKVSKARQLDLWSKICQMVSSDIKRWKGKPTDLFRKANSMFSEREIKKVLRLLDKVRKKQVDGDEITKAKKEFPVFYFLLMALLQCEVLKGSSSATSKRSSLVTAMRMINFQAHNALTISQEAEMDDNCCLVLLREVLAEMLLSDSGEELPELCVQELIPLWLEVGKKDDLLKNSLVAVYLFSDNSATFPSELKSWATGNNELDMESPLAYTSVTETLKTIWKFLPRMANIVRDLLRRDCSSLEIASLLMIFVSTSSYVLQLEDDFWDQDIVKHAVVVCFSVGQVLKIERVNTWVDEEETELRVRPLVHLAANKLENLADFLHPKSAIDLSRLSSLADSIAKLDDQGAPSAAGNVSSGSPNQDCPAWMNYLAEIHWDEGHIGQFKTPQRPSRLSSDLIQTTSKAYIYSRCVASLDDTTPDLREFFDEDEPKKRQKKTGNAFLQACLQEAGGVGGVTAEDLEVLEDFIVPTEGRDYIDTFKRRFSFVQK